MEVVRFLINYGFILLSTINIYVFLRRDQINEKIVRNKINRPNRKIKIKSRDVVYICLIIAGVFGNILIVKYFDKEELNPILAYTIFGEIEDCSEELLEIGIDSIMDDGLLKDLPIVNLICGVCKIGINITERHFLKETLYFINTFRSGNIEQKKLDRYREKLISDPQRAQRELERVTLLLNSHIYSKQSERLGKFYSAFVQGVISWEKYCELSEANSRMFESDYNILNQVNSGMTTNLGYQAERLVALGLLCEANLDIENDTMILGDGVYGCTEFGKTFLLYSNDITPNSLKS